MAGIDFRIILLPESTFLQRLISGFFLMIEAGMIDLAAHHNDTGLMLHEVVRLNETVEYVLDWAENRDDTLVLVTADHTTGGFGISYNANDFSQGVNLPGSLFQGRDFIFRRRAQLSGDQRGP
jgi:alkaline phosphatase